MNAADPESHQSGFHSSEASGQPVESPQRPHGYLRLVVFVTLAVVIGLGYYFSRDRLTLEYFATQESLWKQFASQHPVLIYLIAYLIYAGITGLSLPGAVPLTLTYGWFFGFWQGLILVSFASTTGATLAFLTSRYLFRASIESRYGEKFQQINQQFEKEGAFYLFFMRLVVAFPFFLINVVMGLTTIRTWTYWWVSQIGMLPGTAVFVYAGTSFPTLQKLSEQGATGILTPQLIVAFVLLGTFPLLINKIATYFHKRT
ncbi:SNARE associated Golgi protein [Gimesia panareensis]|uniref:TVP38/TMEM64 family membrane protein n=1 Tax=Gimesia panareensis TaxID=2527978 RepID=A0A517Q6G7_9PLAN|nr:TVP38/TMEM64 family protein [Gimesia panareensis]QDT27229.1 SNARE associated Golgi protein [Gimesia panareensis]